MRANCDFPAVENDCIHEENLTNLNSKLNWENRGKKTKWQKWDNTNFQLPLRQRNKLCYIPGPDTTDETEMDAVVCGCGMNEKLHLSINV